MDGGKAGAHRAPPGKMDEEANRKSLTLAFLAWKTSLTRYVATFFVSREDVEDTVQEIYVQALSSERREEIRSPEAYLFRVARNIAINKKKRQSKIFFENLGQFEEALGADDAPSLFDQVYGRQKLKALNEAIEALPPQCRKVFLMQRMDGLSYKEIAGRLGISTRTVEKHLEKALSRCAEHLLTHGFAEEDQDNVTSFAKYKASE